MLEPGPKNEGLHVPSIPSHNGSSSTEPSEGEDSSGSDSEEKEEEFLDSYPLDGGATLNSGNSVQ